MPGGNSMHEPDLYWFRTRQDLLEEWGYVPTVWHLVRRSAVFITVIALDVRGKPLRSTSLRPRELSETRIPLSLVEPRLCDLIGPFTLEEVPSTETPSRKLGCNTEAVKEWTR